MHSTFSIVIASDVDRGVLTAEIMIESDVLVTQSVREVPGGPWGETMKPRTDCVAAIRREPGSRFMIELYPPPPGAKDWDLPCEAFVVAVQSAMKRLDSDT
jgi:hypothetical protein